MTPASINNQLNLENIVSPTPDPSNEPDQYTTDELLDFSPAKRVNYEHLQLVQRLDRDIDRLRQEKDSLHLKHEGLTAVRLDHERIIVSYRSLRWTSCITAIAMAIGGGLISSATNNDINFGVGWTLLLFAAFMQLVKGIIEK